MWIGLGVGGWYWASTESREWGQSWRVRKGQRGDRGGNSQPKVIGVENGVSWAELARDGMGSSKMQSIS